MKRKIIIIAIVAVVAAGILGAGIFLRSRQQSGAGTESPAGALPAVTSGDSFSSSTQSGTAAGGGAALAQNSVVDYFVDVPGNLFAVEPDGRITMSKRTRTVLDASHTGTVVAARFAPDGTKVAVELAAGSGAAQWNIFDFQKSSWLPLAFLSPAVAWSPDSSQLAYLGTLGRVNAVSAIDFKPATPQTRTILRLSALDMTLEWPSMARLILAEKGAAAAAGLAWSLDPATGSLVPLVQDAPGIELLAGSKLELLFRAAPVKGGSLALLDSGGNQVKALSFLTLPSKCAFWDQASSTNSYLLCAIPVDAQSLALKILPDQYRQMAFFTADNFYKIDLGSGQVTVIKNSTVQNFDATNVKAFGDSLYFVNRLDLRVYRLSF